jgi:hypothetical protein
MKRRSIWAAAMTVAVLAAAACSGGVPTASTTPAVVSYVDYEAAFCSAFTSLIKGVGNPDAGTPSVLSKSLDDAVAAGDVAAADRAATAITAELEAGRAQAATASRWVGGGPSASGMDRVLVAFEAQVAAKRAWANHLPGAADPQFALEKAGGMGAWAALGQGVAEVAIPSGASPKPCPAMQGTP